MEKKWFAKDWKRKLWLFDRLVRTVIGYGEEIWRLRERKEIEGLPGFGGGGMTPGYMIRKKVQRNKLRSRAGGRTLRFEKRLEERRGVSWQKCLRKMRQRMKKGRKLCGREKGKNFWKKRG